MVSLLIVLALKDNDPTLHEDVTLWLDSEINAGQLPVLENEIEKRSCPH
jgi:hypothetical protein